MAPDGHVTFTKTYDGAGGFRHSVRYAGNLAAGAVTGSWTLPGGQSGPFTMTRN